MTAHKLGGHTEGGFARYFALWRDGGLRELSLWANSVNNGTAPTYPGGSKGRVSRAGNAVRMGTATAEDLAVIDTWRAAHRAILNTFQGILRNRVARQGAHVVVAQRHKRKLTIFDKLTRLPRMELARMDDIAGCRLIFYSIEELRAFRAGMHKAKFNHKLRNDPQKYDYIANPKAETGYRGIHDVYEYDVNSPHGKPYKGLFVEIQYRTFVQHAWATAVEVIGLITENEPKFQRGDDRYERLMAYASEILARAHEDLSSCLPELTDENLVREFLELDEEVGLLNLLRSRNAVISESSAFGNVLLMITEGEKLELENYRDATEALRALFKHEKDSPGTDIVLVRAGSPEDVRIAFRNYYTDTSEFVRLLEEGCEKLTGHEAQYFGYEEGLENEAEEEDG